MERLARSRREGRDSSRNGGKCIERGEIYRRVVIIVYGMLVKRNSLFHSESLEPCNVSVSLRSSRREDRGVNCQIQARNRPIRRIPRLRFQAPRSFVRAHIVYSYIHSRVYGCRSRVASIGNIFLRAPVSRTCTWSISD